MKQVLANQNSVTMPLARVRDNSTVFFFNKTERRSCFFLVRISFVHLLGFFATFFSQWWSNCGQKYTSSYVLQDDVFSKRNLLLTTSATSILCKNSLRCKIFCTRTDEMMQTRRSEGESPKLYFYALIHF